MKTLNATSLFICCSLLVACSCKSQESQHDRQPAVAGQFYPSDKSDLQSTLKDLFARAVPSRHFQDVVAIIAPHAGYPYSGEVAASSFNQIDPTRQYDNVFVLGPSHHVGFEGASIYTDGDYVTPLGALHVNRKLAQQLIASSKVFTSRTDAHAEEHSVEVELPFLQYLMKQDISLVPIVVGASDPQTCEKIATALRPYLNTRNLFVISTDFSHYPSYDDAQSVDKATADAVLSNSVRNLVSTLDLNERKQVPNLVTSMCGWSCVLTLLYMTEDNPRIQLTKIEYRNSGDSPIGDKRRVVGYCSIAVSLKEEVRPSGFNLPGRDRRDLLAIARSAVEQYVRNGTVPVLDSARYSDALKTGCGAFVTLNEDHSLRGCIGHFGSDEPLFRVVQEMAIAAATHDYRFQPVAERELGKIDFEISVLTPMRRIHSIDEIELGKHGIYIKKGASGGTFLPQVATETGWSKQEFLGHCAQDKAGIGWDGWKDAEIFIYEALVFGESKTEK